MNGDNEDNVNSSFSSLTGTTTVTILLSKRFVRTISIREQRQEAGDILTSSQDKKSRIEDLSWNPSCFSQSGGWVCCG